MKITVRILAVWTVVLLAMPASADELPWHHGNLRVSDNARYLQHADGTPFFWLADTGWLLPERLNREEAAFYLDCCRQAGYNVVQVQVLNGVPSENAYGRRSHPLPGDVEPGEPQDEFGYWNHLDAIVDAAADRGIYVGMVCIWGGLVKAGLLDEEQAEAYGRFLARRYRDKPNIVWIIGGDIGGDICGDICGDVCPAVWERLAVTIKSVDGNHLMTYHPRGRTLSTVWFNGSAWLDFNMFQSGHRRYGQDKGEANYPIPLNTEENNWRYVERSLAARPLRPVLDGEPSYEEIPQGLHDPSERRWQASDVRRYAYWSVFAGSCGHTYGHNSIMQFFRPGLAPAYGAVTPWFEAVRAEGFNQMKYLKRLMLAFPYFERIPDQECVSAGNGERYERLAATRGERYLLVYNHTGREMTVRSDGISGATKRAWWYSPRNGELRPIGEVKGDTLTVTPEGGRRAGNDWVLIVADAALEWSL